MSEDRRADDKQVRLSIAGVLAILYTIGYFCLTGLLYFVDIPDSNEKPLIFLLGLMSGPQVAIIQWAFGSSQSAEVAQRASEQRQGRSETAVSELIKTVPAMVTVAASAAAANGKSAPSAPEKPA